jgi:HD-GYP domain-containing protein (c-di-GMP phosphodiesterase class II)
VDRKRIQLGTALRSRIARRVFALFVACAILPVSAFAGFAYWKVVGHLEREAGERLRRESKSTAMSILERLVLLDDTFRVALLEAPSGEAWREVARRAALLSHGGIRSVAPWSGGGPAALDEAQQESISVGGAALVITASGDGAGSSLTLIRRDGAGALVAARLDPLSVFAPEARDMSHLYWVTDPHGALLFRSAGTGAPGRAPTGAHPAPGAPSFEAGPATEELVWGSWSLFLRSLFACDSWMVVQAEPRADVLRPLGDFRETFPLVAALSILAVACLALYQIRRSLGPIEALSRASRRIARREYDARVNIVSADEFRDLGEAFNDMAASIQRRDLVMTTVNRIGSALSAERENARLLELILGGSMRVTGADGALLFLNDEDDRLQLEAFELHDRREPVRSTEAPPLRGVSAALCLARGLPVAVDDMESCSPEERSDWEILRRHLGYEPLSLLSVPMQNATGERLGVLQLLRSRPAPGGVAEPFSDAARELAESLASQAGVAISKNRLIDSFRALFEGLVDLTVKAIDEKSPYTGEHCRKVPILTEIIAEAACAADRGPLKDFRLDEQQRYELKIAALLHDCGKVVTPVHVMDKATKLETIHDRIDVVELRYEILKRDLQVRRLEERLAGSGESPSPAERGHLERELAELDEERSFLRHCNVGVEYMPEEERGRVLEIARARRWRGMDGSERSVLEPHEVENLTVVRGTLNHAEREVINYHAVATIKMLEELPFPKGMRAVPAIAGSHHEKMNGRGYPNRLRGEEITLQGRILGLADVFEALTAKDRPYKPGRTLSESLEILAAMCRQGEIDADLFELFVREKLYLRYAALHMSPEQIDGVHQVDLEQLTLPVS